MSLTTVLLLGCPWKILLPDPSNPTAPRELAHTPGPGDGVLVYRTLVSFRPRSQVQGKGGAGYVHLLHIRYVQKHTRSRSKSDPIVVTQWRSVKNLTSDHNAVKICWFPVIFHLHRIDSQTAISSTCKISGWLGRGRRRTVISCAFSLLALSSTTFTFGVWCIILNWKESRRVACFEFERVQNQLEVAMTFMHLSEKLQHQGWLQ